MVPRFASTNHSDSLHRDLIPSLVTPEERQIDTFGLRRHQEGLINFGFGIRLIALCLCEFR